MMDKRIPATGILGQRGVNLIESVVLKMGFLWYPTGQLEAGIDGVIEIRDPASGVVTNSFLQVQSRATGSEWPKETADGFEYHCDARDLNYWMQGNAPVILVVSRPEKNEAYWVSIKNYFKDPASLKTRTVHFDKRTQRFDEHAGDAVRRVALPVDAGVYFAPLPTPEALYTNFLPVQVTAETIYIAETGIRTPKEVWVRLNELGGPIRGDWVLKSGKIMGFNDLSKYPWSTLCRVRSLKEIPTSEWALSDDLDMRRDFVQILNRCLRRKMWQQEVLYDEGFEHYYFRPTPDLSPRTIKYRSMTAHTSRTVFQGYPAKGDPRRIAYYRHSAFLGSFYRHGDDWFLQITPSYEEPCSLWTRHITSSIRVEVSNSSGPIPGCTFLVR